MDWNFQTFDLADWKLTLPVDADYFDGSGDYRDGKAYEILPGQLEGFEAEPFFYYDEAEGALIFRADVDGAKTSSGTNYTRTELREMDGTSRAAWTVDEGGALSATLKVTELATEFDEDNDARVIVGQIHGENDELMRLYYDASGAVYYANERTGGDSQERLFYFVNEDGESPNVSLGETFSYLAEVTGGNLIVQVFADGQVYSATETNGIDPTEIIDDWKDDTFYFKAGVYQGVTSRSDHNHEGTGASEAAFYKIDFSHVPGEGRNAWLGDSPTPTSEDPFVPPPPVPDPQPESVHVPEVVSTTNPKPEAQGESDAGSIPDAAQPAPDSGPAQPQPPEARGIPPEPANSGTIDDDPDGDRLSTSAPDEGSKKGIAAFFEWFFDLFSGLFGGSEENDAVSEAAEYEQVSQTSASIFLSDLIPITEALHDARQWGEADEDGEGESFLI